jgi:hypothetical protein
MFSIPNFPTDSLYKFIFISGLALLLYSSYLQTNQSKDLSIDEVAADSMNVTMGEIIKNDSLYAIETNKVLDNFDKIFDDKSAHLAALTKAKKTHTKEYQESKVNFDELVQKIRHEKLKADSMRKKISTDRINRTIFFSKFHKRAQNYQHTTKLIVFCIYLGLFLFLSGSFSWYFLLQKPQDELNNITLKLAKLQLQKELRIESELLAPPVPSNNSEETT